MQTPQHALSAATVIVLHEIDLESGSLGKRALVVALHEEAACVAKDLGLKDQNIGNGSGMKAHEKTLRGEARRRSGLDANAGGKVATIFSQAEQQGRVR